MFYWFAHYFLFIVSKIFCPVSTQGYENLPRRGGFILASNHESNADPILVGLATGRKICYMAKASLFKNKAFAFILHLVNAFPVKRETSDIRSVREALKRLKGGTPLLLFPEGTRRKKDNNNIKSGIGFLAAKSGMYVIPTKVIDSKYALPPGAHFLRFHPVKVIFGKPLSFHHQKDYLHIANRIKSAIDKL